MANLHTGIKSFSDAITSDVKICTLQSSMDMLIASYPKVQSLLVPVDNWAPAIDGFHAGHCGAVLLPPEKLAYAHAAMAPFDKHGSSGHCNLRRVGEVVLAIPTAIPINRDLDHALSYVWSK